MWGVKDMIYYGRDVCEDVCNALSCSMASSRTRYNALDSMVLVRNVITTIRMSMRQTSKDGMLEGYRNYAWMRACGNDMAKALASPPRYLPTYLGTYLLELEPRPLPACEQESGTKWKSLTGRKYTDTSGLQIIELRAVLPLP